MAHLDRVDTEMIRGLRQFYQESRKLPRANQRMFFAEPRKM